MNSNYYLKSIAFLFVGLLFVGCSDDDDSSSDDDNSQIVNTVMNSVQSGDWVITEFVDSGQDETNHFNDYVFTFSSGGDLTATGNSDTVTGTWSVTYDDSSDDDSPDDDDDIDFNILFNVSEASDFEDLNDDWDIVSYSTTKIELIDISGGNGGTDYLTFEKN